MTDMIKPEKGLTDEQKECLRGILQPIVDARFEGKAARAAKAMRISQPQLSMILLGKRSARSAGVPVLIRIRSFVGMTLDELLGLPPLHKVAAAPANEFQARYKAALVELEEMLERQRTPSEPPEVPPTMPPPRRVSRRR